MNLYQRNNLRGFTLIEVLIALAILSIALSAAIKVTAQNIRETLYLQEKTIAYWAGLEVLNQARIGILKLPMAPEKLDEKSIMLNTTWTWQAHMTATPNPHIYEIHVDVEKEQGKQKLASLTGYLHE